MSLFERHSLWPSCATGTCFDRLHWEAVPNVHHVLDDYRFLLNNEEELAVRPILLRDIPDAGSRAQSHNIPRIQKKATSLPERALPILSADSPTALTAIVEDIRLNKANCEPKLQQS